MKYKFELKELENKAEKVWKIYKLFKSARGEDISIFQGEFAARCKGEALEKLLRERVNESDYKRCG